jgi:hypothetical protein
MGPDRARIGAPDRIDDGHGDGDHGEEGITVKKIPKQVLTRYEWGHDDYSLQVENLPKAQPAPQDTLTLARSLGGGNTVRGEKKNSGQQALDL